MEFVTPLMAALALCFSFASMFLLGFLTSKYLQFSGKTEVAQAEVDRLTALVKSIELQSSSRTMDLLDQKSEITELSAAVQELQNHFKTETTPFKRF